MEKLRFAWDPNKNEKNIKKHNITFEEDSTVFYDENARIIDDPDHSEMEERCIILGMSNQAGMLVVCHCYRDNDSVIRLISARRATKNESKQYYDFY